MSLISRISGARLEALKTWRQARLTDRDMPLPRELNDLCPASIDALFKQAGLSRCLWEHRTARLRNHDSNTCHHIQAAADRAKAHDFTLLDSGPLSHGPSIDWHRDARSGYRWPDYMDYIQAGRKAFDEIVNPDGDREIKYPWDLSNLMWLPTLGLAYQLDRTRQDARELIDIITDWRKHNPWPMGVNWFCAMNVAMRAINMMVGMSLTLDAWTTRQLQPAIALLFQHGRFIAAHLEVDDNGFRNNHYLTNLVGLSGLGLMFRHLPEGEQWLAFARTELSCEVDEQWLDDGACFENATNYHRLSTEMMLWAYQQAKQADMPLPDHVKTKLGKAVAFTNDITQGNGYVPLFGDNDNGRLIQFTTFEQSDVRDHRALVAVGRCVLDMPDIPASATDYVAEAIIWTGKIPESQETDHNPSHMIHYPHAGYYGIKTNQLNLLLRNAQLHPAERGGHAHCDALAYTVNWRGQDLFVDAGTYRYSSHFQMRNLFRSIQMHNTIQINNHPMHQYDAESFEGLWTVADRAQAQTLDCSMTDQVWQYAGHYTQTTETQHWQVSRTLSYAFQTNTLNIADRVHSLSTKLPVDDDKAYVRYLLSPGITVERLAHNRLVFHADNQPLAEMIINRPIAGFRLQPQWYAPAYGSIVQTSQIQITWSPKQLEQLDYQIKFHHEKA
jgi:uncharacterized heparinase superfamily protein